MRAPRNATLNRRSVSSLLNLVSVVMPKRRPVGFIHTPEGKRFPVKLHTRSSARAAFRPYSASIGQVALTWNILHDNLVHLFQTIVKSQNAALPYKIWFAVDSDFLQRKMLRAAVDANADLTQLQRDEICWILNQIDNSLRYKRNDALHAPLMLTTGVVDDMIRSWVEASMWSANPRAKALRNKNFFRNLRIMNYLQKRSLVMQRI